MNKMYGIFHELCVDGGYGDAVYEEDLLGIVNDEETAKKYVEKYSNPHTYDIPYDDLEAGELTYRELECLTMDVSPSMLGLDEYFNPENENYCSWVKRDDIPMEKAMALNDEKWSWDKPRSPNSYHIRIRNSINNKGEIWVDEAHYKD